MLILLLLIFYSKLFAWIFICQINWLFSFALSKVGISGVRPSQNDFGCVWIFFSLLYVLEQFKWFGVICSLRVHWIHLWTSQAINGPFGGGQWKHLGLDFLEAEPETRILVKEVFWGSAPRRREEGSRTGQGRF